MARIRSIHPGLFTDEAFMTASVYARLLLPGIWCEAWDDGVIEWRPLRLKARLFPVDNVDVEGLMAELVALEFLKPFEVDGREYAAIRNFRKWQNPKKPNSSGVLPPELAGFVGLPLEEGRQEGGDTAPPEIPHQGGTASARLENQFRTGSELAGQKGGREEGKKGEYSLFPREARAAPDEPGPGERDGFAEFWEAYPAAARRAPDFARKAYQRALKRGATPELILAAVRRERWRDDPRYIPAPERWLDGGSWRMAAAEAEAAPAAQQQRMAVRNQYAGWDVADHMALADWDAAEASGEWRSRDARRNQLPLAQRRAELWADVQRRSPKAARLIEERGYAGLECQAAA